MVQNRNIFCETGSDECALVQFFCLFPATIRLSFLLLSVPPSLTHSPPLRPGSCLPCVSLSTLYWRQGVTKTPHSLAPGCLKTTVVTGAS